MGSLPNLHELRHRDPNIQSGGNVSSDDDSSAATEFRHTAPITGNHRIVVNDERLIRKPKPQHTQLCRTRSGPAANHNLVYDPGLVIEVFLHQIFKV